jgi:hypothetical protein
MSAYEESIQFLGGVHRTTVALADDGGRGFKAGNSSAASVLRGVTALNWRRLLVPSDANIGQLHGILQGAFSCEDIHTFTALTFFADSTGSTERAACFSIPTPEK